MTIVRCPSSDDRTTNEDERSGVFCVRIAKLQTLSKHYIEIKIRVTKLILLLYSNNKLSKTSIFLDREFLQYARAIYDAQFCAKKDDSHRTQANKSRATARANCACMRRRRHARLGERRLPHVCVSKIVRRSFFAELCEWRRQSIMRTLGVVLLQIDWYAGCSTGAMIALVRGVI